MSHPTVREMVAAIQREVRGGELSPGRASHLLLTLGALYGNCNEEIRAADAEYANVLLRLLDSDEAANRARIRAETTPAFDRKQEARNTKELVKEMVGSLKYFLRAQAEEMRL